MSVPSSDTSFRPFFSGPVQWMNGRQIRLGTTLPLKKSIMQFDGHHLVADFWNCRLPDDPDGWRRVIRAAVDAMGVTLLRLDVHSFCPEGITAVAMLAESHLAVHTWPERGYVAIDIFTCGAPARTEAGIEVLRRELQPEHRRILKIERGGPHSPSSFEEFTCRPLAESAHGSGEPCR